MTRYSTSRLATLAAALLACACSSAEPRVAPQAPGPAASPGDPATRPATAEQPGPALESAPAFSLRDHQGTEHSLATLTASGPTVLVFYRGHWWPYCRKQLGELSQNIASITELGASLAGISTDPAGDSAALAKKHSISFPLLADENLEVIRRYGVENTGHDIAHPAVFVVTRQGDIAWKYIGENPADRALLSAILDALRKLKQQ